jgi:hypothetical protein
MKLTIWTAILVIYLFFLYRLNPDAVGLIVFGPVLLSMGMICRELRSVMTYLWLRRSLTVLSWVLFAGCATAVLLMKWMVFLH